MASRAMAITTVILRILTLLLAAGCVVVLILDKATDDVDGSKTTFKDVITYKYVLATAVVAAAYSILQLPFAMYYACSEKRLLRGDFMPAFDFYADKVIAFLLASGVGAGFLVTVELKKFLDDLFLQFGADLEDSPLESFFNKGYLAVGLLAGAFLCMAVLSILSSLQRTNGGGKGFFFR